MYAVPARPPRTHRSAAFEKFAILLGSLCVGEGEQEQERGRESGPFRSALAVLPCCQPCAASVGQAISLQPAARPIGNRELDPSFVHRGLDVVLPERGAVLDPKGLPERIGSLVSVHEQKQEALDRVARLGRLLGR